MKKVYADEKRPIKSWVTGLEDGALEQAKNLANLPFLHKHVALMPDAHYGFGMPIGGVIATEGVVIPNAVGVDIGCGMCAVKTGIKVEEITPHLKTIMGKVRNKVPMAFGRKEKPCDVSKMPNGVGGFQNHSYILLREKYPVVNEQFASAQKQLGTLGGGNHFIEFQKDEEDFVWVMIHSGSRNLGLKVAKHYNDIAKEMNKKWHSSVPAEHDLAFLPLESEVAKSYLREMQYCVDFAFENRKAMMEEVMGCMAEVMDIFKFGRLVNIAHNYAKMENHFGKNVMVHRKGATSAQKGEIGIIPGSQGTSSYIVRGLGNPDSFKSCSHGAGRKMGRKEAIRTLKIEDELKHLNDKGIVHSIRNKKDLDEAPGSYKDIEVVMENQKDLVDIITKLEPLAVMKG